jgi:glycosyltransferase involved in cell wall biosynthesis
VRSAAQYDLVVIQREAFMTGSTYFERQLKRSGAKMIFDFDDSIWLTDVSDANRRWAFLKDPGKTSRIIAMSDMVFAGNRYLADYARQFNRHVRMVPTTIDTEEYQRVPLPNRDDVCIGWSGSMTTVKHFEYAVPFLLRIKDKYGDKVSIKMIGDRRYRHERLGIQGVSWIKEDELKELSGIDIGIMPLPDDEWSRGKCGLKGLQYMALEIPAVMSPVGVNTEIISDGTNGFLARTEDEWVNKISALVESATLRSKIGKAGRATVEERYSVKSQAQNYLRYFDEVLGL